MLSLDNDLIKGSQQLANGLRDLWHMDDQCKRSAVFLLSADDRHLYYAPQPNTLLRESPISRQEFALKTLEKLPEEAEFQSIAASGEMLLQTGEFVPALVKIFKEIGKKTDDGPVTTPHSSKHASSTLFCISSALTLLLLL
ncbi:hypothetical protein OESDEN_01791 [Oesophagostomum dentatum]|uniref:Uncharacterized protein n=1 Tax=Oesophagostomum dentatum TaxID=61180 RepID=A0A0B1TLX1_OESDE|nr:hypothetical protein OESDEN_01791 [Oesophagostomum dentatum]